MLIRWWGPLGESTKPKIREGTGSLPGSTKDCRLYHDTLLEQDISVGNGFFLQFAAATRFELSVVLSSNNPDSYQEAVGLLQDARELYEMTGDREAIAEKWNALADLYTAIGDVKARELPGPKLSGGWVSGV